MSELSKFHVILNAEGWEDYKKTVTESFDDLKDLKIQTSPKSYPCLAAALIISETDIRFCFVYESDAMDLLSHSIDDDEVLVVGADELILGNQSEDYTEEDYSDLEEVPKTKNKMEINPLVLGMFLELEAIGALKTKKVLQAMEYCSTHMTKIVESNKTNVYDTFEQFLEELRTAYRAN